MKTFLASIFASLVLAVSAQAVPVKGVLLFGGGTVTLDNSNLSLATRVVSWANPQIVGASGDFVVGPIVFSNNWVFSGGLSPLWFTGGFTFNLYSSQLESQTALALVIGGTGVVSGNGFDPTPMSWTFTTQKPDLGGAIFSWSASGAAQGADGGTTAMLLGGGLAALGVCSRRFSSRRDSAAS